MQHQSPSTVAAGTTKTKMNNLVELIFLLIICVRWDFVDIESRNHLRSRRLVVFFA